VLDVREGHGTLSLFDVDAVLVLQWCYSGLQWCYSGLQ
jgi:hypothetical protein